ncbi:uncharacterized protein LOC128238593 [Mya arenaria]|uniref:uncharacterized protein LOC128238593 n=1 Tax=Mya arenaria TaxID=6604 RepID=UPI0022E856E0|nr:uncharacterized protein LOC128238593 [Mya arenaria]
MNFSSGSPPGLNKGEDIETALNQYQQQIMMQQSAKKLEEAVDSCFRKCVTKPGSSLDKNQQKCLGQCVDVYLEASGIVSRAVAQRLQQMGSMG